LTPAYEGIGVLNHVEIKRNDIALGILLKDGFLNMVNMVDLSFKKDSSESIPIVSLIANKCSI
jgi:hypothetical protein